MTPPFTLRLLTLAALVPLGAAVSVFSQPTGARDGFELSTRYSHTGRSDLDVAGPASSAGIDSYQLGLRTNTSLTETTSLLYGLECSRHELDRAGPHWLPENLKSLAAPLGVSHRFNDRWRLLATISPRLAGAGGDLGSAGFDLPVMAPAGYTTIGSRTTRAPPPTAPARRWLIRGSNTARFAWDWRPSTPWAVV